MAALFGYLCAVVLILSSLLIGFASVFDGGNHSQVLDRPKAEALNKVERQKSEAVKDRIEGADKSLNKPTATPHASTPVTAAAAVEPTITPSAPAVLPAKTEAAAASPAPGARAAKPEKKKVARKSRPAQRRYVDRDDDDDGGWIVERRERRGVFGLFADE
jgi:hypothetical protein